MPPPVCLAPRPVDVLPRPASGIASVPRPASGIANFTDSVTIFAAESGLLKGKAVRSAADDDVGSGKPILSMIPKNLGSGNIITRDNLVKSLTQNTYSILGGPNVGTSENPVTSGNSVEHDETEPLKRKKVARDPRVPRNSDATTLRSGDRKKEKNALSRSRSASSGSLDENTGGSEIEQDEEFEKTPSHLEPYLKDAMAAKDRPADLEKDALAPKQHPVVILHDTFIDRNNQKRPTYMDRDSFLSKINQLITHEAQHVAFIKYLKKFRHLEETCSEEESQDEGFISKVLELTEDYRGMTIDMLERSIEEDIAAKEASEREQSKTVTEMIDHF